MADVEVVKNKMKSHKSIVYLDECAAGGLCFDLFVCGVIISEENILKIPGINDSKKLTEGKRKELYPKILELATDYEVVRVSPEMVDQLNIFQARMFGFKKAIEILSQRSKATYAIIDGNKLPLDLPIEADCVIKADALIPGVSCASIIAKHEHTSCIYELCKDEKYSKYQLDKHKGYGTKLHMEKLKEHGPIPGFHRYSYAPVRAAIKKTG